MGLAVPAYAACPPMFAPSGLTVVPDDNAQVFVSYSEQERLETLVIQPEFSGTATEFGMVLPLPGRPEINEAPDDLFTFLATYTGRHASGAVLGLATESVTQSGLPEQSVVVVERKDVGDFETTLLVASDAQDLADWLNDRGFQFAETDVENFDYYVQKGGYYFAAMKVNMDEAEVGENGEIDGRLRPIEFVFPSEQPMLPLRIMSGEMDPMRMTLYTLADFPYYVRGIEVDFAKKIEPRSAEALIYRHTSGIKHYDSSPSFDKYDPIGKWLVRMSVDFDPREIEMNVLLQRADPDALVFGYWGHPAKCQICEYRLNSQDGTLVLKDGILREYGLVRGFVAPTLGYVPFDRNTIVINPYFPPGTQLSVTFEPVHNQFLWESISAWFDRADDLKPPTPGIIQDGSKATVLLGKFADTTSPREQAEHGIPPKSIECRDGLQLMLRPGGQSSACVGQKSIPIMTEWDWQVSTERSEELARLS